MARVNKIDSILMEEPLARSCTAQYPQIKTASIIKREAYSFAMPQGSPLYRAINRVISELKDSGELADMIAKWCSAEPEKKEFEQLGKCFYNIPQSLFACIYYNRGLQQGFRPRLIVPQVLRCERHDLYDCFRIQ